MFKILVETFRVGGVGSPGQGAASVVIDFDTEGQADTAIHRLITSQVDQSGNGKHTRVITKLY